MKNHKETRCTHLPAHIAQGSLSLSLSSPIVASNHPRLHKSPGRNSLFFPQSFRLVTSPPPHPMPSDEPLSLSQPHSLSRAHSGRCHHHQVEAAAVRASPSLRDSFCAGPAGHTHNKPRSLRDRPQRSSFPTPETRGYARKTWKPILLLVRGRVFFFFFPLKIRRSPLRRPIRWEKLGPAVATEKPRNTHQLLFFSFFFFYPSNASFFGYIYACIRKRVRVVAIFRNPFKHLRDSFSHDRLVYMCSLPVGARERLLFRDREILFSFSFSRRFPENRVCRNLLRELSAGSRVIVCESRKSCARRGESMAGFNRVIFSRSSCRKECVLMVKVNARPGSAYR